MILLILQQSVMPALRSPAVKATDYQRPLIISLHTEDQAHALRR